MRTALVAGSTGLIGKQLVNLLLDDEQYNRVKAISRTPLAIAHAKLENLVIDFDRLSENHERLTADDVYCCLGTTIKKAGSEKAFRRVDFEYPLELARLTKNAGAKTYLLVSALGADRHSRIFYNRVKGETEVAIREVGFQAFHIFQPSLLLGPREEKRAGEDAAKVFYKLFGWLMPSSYKAIDSLKVARAMVHVAKQNATGLTVHESKSLQAF
ncbi:NAD(P)H-binding protein [Oscillatoria amoena NRMC-F 0135]|nr:NAD(P)H-binding protein [Oscillatoria amoena NRMC-F 0135]